MAKPRPLRKTGRKAGSKSAKNGRRGSGQPKRSGAKSTRAVQGGRTSARPVRKIAAGAAAGVVERPVVTPEIPPPLPAPIASFTF